MSRPTKTTTACLRFCGEVDALLRGYRFLKKTPKEITVTPFQMNMLEQESERGTLPLYIQLDPPSYRGIALKEI